jgi:hypothetical protein
LVPSLTSSFLLYMPVFASLEGGKVALAGGKLVLEQIFGCQHFFYKIWETSQTSPNFMLCPFLMSRLVNSYFFCKPPTLALKTCILRKRLQMSNCKRNPCRTKFYSPQMALCHSGFYDCPRAKCPNCATKPILCRKALLYRECVYSYRITPLISHIAVSAFVHAPAPPFAIKASGIWGSQKQTISIS